MDSNVVAEKSQIRIRRVRYEGKRKCGSWPFGLTRAKDCMRRSWDVGADEDHGYRLQAEI